MIVKGVNQFHRSYISKMRVRLVAATALFVTSSWIYIIEPFGIRQPDLAALGAGVSLIVALFHSFSVFGKPYCCFHPYFYESLNGKGRDTAFGGHAIAERLDELDIFAQDHEIRPLSSFGFRDSFNNAEVDWHSPDEGLSTVEWLLEHAELHEAERDELSKIAKSLRVAIESNVQFCFHMRFADGTSGLEHERREGSYW
jgi:hypothetical protein